MGPAGAVCRACGTELRHGARFCDGCGAPAPEPGEQAEFKQVTVLFADVVGSLGIASAVGAERLREMMAAVFGRAATIIRRYGGTVDKFTGDGIMASFASVARAVDCAIAIQAAFETHNATDPSGAMRVRIGLSAGEPIEDHEDLFGAAVNLARRTCDAAAAGEIFATNVVRELCLGKRFRFGDRGDTLLKGFDEPVRLFDIAWQPAPTAN